MQFVAIDIETTGLDRARDQVLQVALVYEDTHRAEVYEVKELPFFEGLIYHDRIEGHPYALNMNHEILEVFAGLDPALDRIEFRGREVPVYASLAECLEEGQEWLTEVYEGQKGPYVAAGKNAEGFDFRYLPEDWRKLFHYRVIDPGSVALGAQPFRWAHNRVPSLGELADNECPHDALGDARAVVTMLRKVGGYL